MKKTAIAVIVLSLIMIFSSCSIKDIDSMTTVNKNIKKTISNYSQGNTSGNLENFGYTVSNNDFLYFSNFYDNNKLYRYQFKTGEIKELLGDSVSNLNLLENKLFFTNESHSSSIYTINTDGSNKKQLLNKECHYLVAQGNKLYFNVMEEGQNPYEMNTNGTGLKRLSKAEAEYLLFYNGALYYTNWSNDGKLTMLNTNTMVEEPTTIKNADGLSCNKDYIYYVRGDLFRYSPQELKEEMVLQQPFSYYHVMDNKIYYIRNTKPYVYDLENKSVKLVADNKVDWIFNCGDYIGFITDVSTSKKGLLLINKQTNEKRILTNTVKIIN